MIFFYKKGEALKIIIFLIALALITRGIYWLFTLITSEQNATQGIMVIVLLVIGIVFYFLMKDGYRELKAQKRMKKYIINGIIPITTNSYVTGTFKCIISVLYLAGCIVGIIMLAFGKIPVK